MPTADPISNRIRRDTIDHGILVIPREPAGKWTPRSPHLSVTTQSAGYGCRVRSSDFVSNGGPEFIQSHSSRQLSSRMALLSESSRERVPSREQSDLIRKTEVSLELNKPYRES